MKVAEKFVSINGEGTRAGELAVFIRFSGCNMRCSYCDTAWANAKDCLYTEMTPDGIADYIKTSGIRNVTITGGEPLIQDGIKKLLGLLTNESASSVRVEVETNGSVDISDFAECRPVFTLDYKLPSSGCEEFMLKSNFEFLVDEDTVKFVIGSENDLRKAAEIINEYKLSSKCNVYLSPVFGAIEPEKIVAYMIDNRLNNVRLQIQMHKVIWDPDKKGV